MTTWKIGVASSFTAESLARFDALTREGFADIRCEYIFAPFGQVEHAALNHADAFNSTDLSAIWLLWRIEDLSDPMFRSARGDYAQIVEAVRLQIDHLIAAVDALSRRFSGTVALALPPMPRTAGAGAGAPLPALELLDLYLYAHNALRSAFRASPTVRLLDLDDIVRDLGTSVAYDARKWYLYKQPFSDKCLRALAHRAQRLLAAGRIASKKCLVIDCDNTIWGGVISEDGLGGIQLGDSFPGNAFVDLQREILALKNRGVFIAVASKNDLDVVQDVFENHDGMILQAADISVFEVNWGPKSESLRRIAQTLNIGLDSLVLLDDNPAEVAEVNANAPEASTILLPNELTMAPETLRNSLFFDTWRLTREDEIRRSSAIVEAERAKLQSRASPEEYLSSLGIVVEVFEVDDQHLDRVTQLINKTNQFNLTTKRRSLGEVRALIQAPDHRIFAFEVKDRFGEYGLVGVIITAHANNSADIDTWLMSCRVLSRGVEQAVFHALTIQLEAMGVQTIRGRYLPTTKNSMVQHFLRDLGFIEGDDAWLYKLDLKKPVCPPHVQVIVRARH